MCVAAEMNAARLAAEMNAARLAAEMNAFQASSRRASIIFNVLSDGGATLNSALGKSDMLVTLGSSGGAALNDVGGSALGVVLGSAPEGLGASDSSVLGSAHDCCQRPARRSVALAARCSARRPMAR